MASETDPFSMNIRGVSDLVGSKTNKIPGNAGSQVEGVVGELEDVLALDLDDGKLLLLAKRREAQYLPYEGKIKPRQEKNKKYYLGKQMEGSMYATDDGVIAGNLLFEAEETFLPAALSKNPEPVVYADNSPEGNKLSNDVKTMLQYHADQLVLRRKLAQGTRQWSIYLLGVWKHGWNTKIKDITLEVRKIQDFLFDPNGSVDAYGDFDSWIGERITVTAEKLIEMFPKHADYITVMVDGKLGTEVTYTEWWEDDISYLTFKDVILDKHKNEFFNYQTSEEDEYGATLPVEPKNHFAAPKKPYTFLSVFSLGEEPHDITGLIEQNIPNQNLVTRRTYQIDYNLSKANNSDVFSEDNFNQETAKQAANALAKGRPILVPKGRPIGEALARLQAPGISSDFFRDLQNNQESLRSSFGIEGITAQQPSEDTTARGMILNQQYANDRIGGGIGTALEQVADNIFNWWVQLYYVFYDEQHTAAILGQMKATEFITLSANSFDRHVIVSVSPDSMKPKDEVTVMNQALTLWQEGALDPKTLLTILNFPDPQNTAAQVVLWKTNPQLYIQLNFPDLQQLILATTPIGAPMQQQPGQAPQGQLGAPIPQTPEPTLGGEPANASLSQVPLPQ